MTTAATVNEFLALVTDHPEIGAEFVRVRSLWQQAHTAKSRELAEAAGEAFGHVCDLVAVARGVPLDAAEERVLQDMVRIPATGLERPN